MILTPKNIDDIYKKQKIIINDISENSIKFTDSDLVSILSLFNLTQEERFLNLFIQYIDNLLKYRSDKLNRKCHYHNRIMKSWGAWETSKEYSLKKIKNKVESVTNQASKYWICKITVNAKYLKLMTDFALIVKNNQTKYKKYLTKASEYTKIAVDTIDEFNEDYISINGYSQYKYYLRGNNQQWEAVNHLSIIGELWINLYDLGHKKFQQKIKMYISVFIMGVKYKNGKANWNYFPFPVTKKWIKNTRSKNGYSKLEPTHKLGLTLPFFYKINNHDSFKNLLPNKLISGIKKTVNKKLIKKNKLKIYNKRVESIVNKDPMNIAIYRLFEIWSWISKKDKITLLRLLKIKSEYHDSKYFTTIHALLAINLKNPSVISSYLA